MVFEPLEEIQQNILKMLEERNPLVPSEEAVERMNRVREQRQSQEKSLADELEKHRKKYYESVRGPEWKPALTVDEYVRRHGFPVRTHPEGGWEAEIPYINPGASGSKWFRFRNMAEARKVLGY